MKTPFQTHTSAVLSRSSILVTVSLLCFYSAGTNPLQAGPQKASSVTTVSPEVQVPYRDSLSENDADYIAARREYLKRLFGSFPPGVSPAEYYRNAAAVRALPTSPLMRGRWEPVSPQASDPNWPLWSFPISPPISTYEGYGGDASAMIHAIGPHPTDSAIVYAGNYGGLVKSTDGGENWQYISDTWLSQEVSSIAVDPNAGNYVYVGTGRNDVPAGAGLYRSFNGGASWTNLGATEFQGSIITKVAIDPNASGSQSLTTLYVANDYSGTSGLWRSTNSGSGWTHLRNVAIYDIAIDPSANPSILYTSESDGVYRGVYSILSHSYVFTRIYISEIPGAWNTLRVVNSVPYLLASTAPLNPINRLYKYNQRSHLWTEIGTPCDAGEDCQPINPSYFAVDPNNPEIILAGSVRLSRTTNASASDPTWTTLEYGELHVDQRALEFSPAQSGLVYSGHDGGIGKSPSSGASTTWTNLNVSLPGVLLQSIAISKDDTMIGGTQDNGTVFTHQRAPWHMINDGDGGRAMIDPVISTAYYSMAGGIRWFMKYIYPGPAFSIRPTELDFPPAGDHFCHPLPSFSLNPSYPQHIIASCERVMRSENGGTNWTQIGPAVGTGGLGQDANTVAATCEAPSNPSVIYAVANNWGQHVYVTSDAQNGIDATWMQITTNLPAGTEIWGLAVDATDPETAYVSCNSGVFRTTDMGSSWENLTPGLLNVFYPSLALDPNNPSRIFAATRWAGVLGSIDGGETWTNINDGLPSGVYITQLSFNGVSRQLALATYGRGAYLLDLDDVAPEVSITAPGNGGVVSGTVVVSANASDNHRVVGVQFKVNGNPIGSEDTSFRYSINWDTTSFAPGKYDLTAVARDPANNITVSDAITVTVDN